MIREQTFWTELESEGILYDSKEDLHDSLYEGGSTACVVFVRNNHLITANAGRSRCIICRKDKAFHITTDHTRYVAAEAKRIHDAKKSVSADEVISGKDTQKEETEHSPSGEDSQDEESEDEPILTNTEEEEIEDPEFTRAIGYLKYKNKQHLSAEKQIIIAKPAVKTVDLRDDIDYVLLAPEDFWLQVPIQTAVENINSWIRKGHNLSSVCEKLRLQYYALLDDDSFPGTTRNNVIIIIVQLKTLQPQEPTKASSKNTEGKVLFKQRTNLVQDPDSWGKLSKKYVLARDREPDEVLEVLRVADLMSIGDGDEDGPKFRLPSHPDRLNEYNADLRQMCLGRGKVYLTRKPHIGKRIAGGIKLVESLITRSKITSVRGASYRLEHICDHENSDTAIREISLLSESTRSSLNLYGTPMGSISGAVFLFANGRKVDCEEGGVGGMKVPVESEKGTGITHIARKDGSVIDYILLVEKESVFLILTEIQFPAKNNCVLITGGGMPDLATRTTPGKAARAPNCASILLSGFESIWPADLFSI